MTVIGAAGRANAGKKVVEPMSDKGNYEYPAWCQMETALQCYAEDRQEYLESEANGLGPDGRRRLGDFNEAADSLARGVQNLAGIDGVVCLSEFARSANFQQGKPFELLDEHMCITFGREALGMLSTARERFLDLLLLFE
jgi:hypothetical protein